jgi:hypothetical protein
MKIGNKEKSIIHLAKNHLGLSDDEYRDILRAATGAESSKDMDYHQYDKLLQRFKELGFKVTSKTNGRRQPYLTAPGRDPGALPTPAQQKKLNDLYDELGWAENERRIGFNRRMLKKPWPQTRAEANKITEALKAMIARMQKSR